MFALLAPVLAGMAGLVIDGGLMMAAQRQAQNAADAAAMAAAQQKMLGASDSTAVSEANSFLTKNGVSGVTLTLNGGSSNAVNIPPQTATSPYYNTDHYVEAIVTRPVTTLLIQALGVNSSQQVTARAVAGYETAGAGEGAIVLDPTAAPGIQINNNNARLIVNGSLVINSQGQGVDQFGNTVGTLNSPAVKVSNSTTTPAPIVASLIRSVGGVTSGGLDNLRVYDSAFTGGSTPNYYYDPSNVDRPLFANVPIAPDPLASLETPTTSPSAGSTKVVNTNQGSVSVSNGQTVTLNPGIYTNIKITGGTVTFNPGIYVLSSNNQNNGLAINGGTVTGSNVMFYATGSSYNATKSYSPLSNPPADANNAVTTTGSGATGLASISINGGTVNLSPITDASSPFNGLLIYQARLNNSTFSVGGNSNSVNLTGTAYAKWANFMLAGQGQYNAQFIVGSMNVSGNGIVTINAAGRNRGLANVVFLVE